MFNSKSNKTKKSKSKPTTLYLDVDDVVLNSCETTIDIINEKYRKPLGLPAKTIKDLKDWGFKSIYKDITSEELNEIFCSREFWDRVTIKSTFYSLISSGILKNYEIIFVTKGNDRNISYKEKLFRKVFGGILEYELISIPCHVDKSTIDMAGGIQVDDNFRNLIHTNAALKILVTNGLETNFNNAYRSIDNDSDNLLYNDNLYYINDIEDIKEILEFNLKTDYINW